MIILEGPYVSDLLKQTLGRGEIPVLSNEYARGLTLNNHTQFIEEEEFIRNFRSEMNRPLYSNSENAISWINENLNFTDIPDKINLFKDKNRFREFLTDLYPGYLFKKVKFSELEKIPVEELTFPLVVKPNVGFFSLAVKMVDHASEWQRSIQEIKDEIEYVTSLYPETVMSLVDFIIEEKIEGEEFAIDFYYNKDGKPVILNILKHYFRSGKDTSDRAYQTSANIIREYYHPFMSFLKKLGAKVDVVNFPVHIELRVNKKNEIIPIEANPMRFAGWCVTDMAYFAYNINPYEYFLQQLQPDWQTILSHHEGVDYNMIIADIPKDIKQKDVAQFDYAGLEAMFSEVLELREIDYQKFSLFAFVFARTIQNNHAELEKLLETDFKELITLKH